MIKIGGAILALCAAAICTAQPAVAQPAVMNTQSAPAKPKHFRLTFVLTYPDGQLPAQSYALDIPVMPDRPGTSSLTLSASTAGQDEGSVQQTLQCTDVQESTTGLAANVAFTIDRVSLEPLPGSDEPLHNQFTVERKIDLIVGRATQLTDDAQRKPLGNANGALPRSPAPPQITVTATAL